MSDEVAISLGDEFVPPDSDIVVKIDFDEADGSVARVFEIAADLIRSFEDLDRVLVTSIDTKIATELVLEDLQKSSIKVFLRNLLKAADDQALRDMDWKKQVGKYLLQAKYVALEWLDEPEDDGTRHRVEDLTERFRRLAEETDARQLPDYPALNPSRVAQPLDRIQRAKSKFREGEGLTVTLGGDEYHVNLGSTWLPSERVDEAAIEHELSNEMDVVLIIRKPDFLGNTQWQFRLGKRAFSAPIEDHDWLAEFHNGNHPLKPGDALKVRMRVHHKYDEKGDLVEGKETIIQVLSIIHGAAPPDDLFNGEDTSG